MRSPATISISWACSRKLGRFFHPADEHGPDSAPYLVLSDALWRTAFHADPAIVGATVELDQHPFTVVGVATAHFHGTERFVWPDYWMPMVNEGQVELGQITCIAGRRYP